MGLGLIAEGRPWAGVALVYLAVQHWHGTSSGGTAGQYQTIDHGTGSDRSVDASGSVMFEGVSLTAGAIDTSGWLFASKTGWVDVMH